MQSAPVRRSGPRDRSAPCYHPRVTLEELPELPQAFRRRMEELLGAEAQDLFGALAQPPAVGLRLNPRRGDVMELAARLPWPLTSVPWCAYGYLVERDAAPPPGRHPYQEAGVYYLQDPAAMAVAEALAPEPGELVIDLAAAPGGKSTHLGAMLAGDGWLVANDVHPQRARSLLGNLERCGVPNAVVTNEPVERLARAWPATFDRVLLDAPCSGEGMFRKSADARGMWSEENVAACAVRQAELLPHAAALVKPGGYLAYSTCTFAPEENEAVIARFLSERDDFRLVPLELPGTAPGRPEWAPAATPAAVREALAGAARIWPHRAAGEGHFVALLRRAGDAAGDPAGGPTANSTKRRGRSAAAVPKVAMAAWHGFAEDALAPGWAERLTPAAVHGEWLVSTGTRATEEPTPRIPALDGLRSLRAGLQLGRLRQGRRDARLEPAHALAMALPGEAVAARLSLSADDARLATFLRGGDVEALGAPGYLRVEVDGFPLGWGKRSGAVVRSLIPKGLRRSG